MRVRIVRPLPASLEGVDLSPFGFGAAYDIKAPLCDLLVTLGYAVPDDAAFVTADTPATANDSPRRRRPKRG